MIRQLDELQAKINGYKRKYLLGQILKGGLLTGIIVGLCLLLLLTVEHYFWMSPGYRGFMFFGFLLLSLYLLTLRVIFPALQLFGLFRPMKDSDAARMLGDQNSSIQDRLINTLQLRDMASGPGSQLMKASLEQRSSELGKINFSESISWDGQKRLALYFSLPLSIAFSILFLNPAFYTGSGSRIINFTQEYVPPAPFDFHFDRIPDHSFRNEDLNIQISTSGELLPEGSFLWVNGDRRKMSKIGPGTFQANIRRVQQDLEIRFEAEGFFSTPKTVLVHDRPIAAEMKVVAEFPAYTGWSSKAYTSMGTFRVPVGTRFNWGFGLRYSDSVLVLGDSNKVMFSAQPNEDQFDYQNTFSASNKIEFLLKNEFGTNKEPLISEIDLIEDQRPRISLRSLADSTLFSFVALGGEISDDYGFTGLFVKHVVRNADGGMISSGTERIPINRSIPDQDYFFRWNTEDLGLESGQKLEYYLEVVDNDGFMGPKSTRTPLQFLMIPDDKEIRKEIDRKKEEFMRAGSSTKNSLEELQEEIKEFQDDTRNKKELDWQDKKRLEELLEEHRKLEKDIEELKEDLNKIRPQEEKYSEQSEELQEKTRQLEKLMEEVLDEETKRLLEELKELLEEKEDNEKIQQKLSDLERKDSQYQKELDRALELFKQLQFDQKMEQTIQELEELAEKQDQLAEESEQGEKPKDQLAEDQEGINEEFENLQEEFEELKKMDEELENPRDLEDEGFEDDMEEISEKMEESKEMMDSGKPKKGSQKQKESSQKMKELAENMMDFQSSSEMEMLSEDIENLRALLENLIQLSFEQERIMTEFRKVHRTDPRYVELSQEQLKLQSDVRIVEDSLYALASRLFQIEGFVTKEMAELNYQMDESIRLIRERRPGKATVKQQFAMTSVNNLALMLDNVLQQLQEQMANQMKGDQMCSKPNGNKPSPSLSQMQKELNKKIRDLKKGGAEGRQLSEELMKLAQQQEQIREGMEKLGEGGNQIDKELQKQLDELGRLMEDSEKDLVHKRLTRELLERQEEIETRLLESEKADRERELKEEREGELAQDFEREVPPNLEEYIKSKESQIELLKTISPNLNPYFKEKVNQYFEEINFETNPRQR